jgi:putative Ca2+/H+ antiporter (TMEM165/GDT1 family)
VNHRAGAVLGIALLLALAELGDKTQLTVAVLSTVQPPAGTWLGATLGLLGTSAVAAWVGQGLVERVPMAWVKRVAALLFLLMGCWAGIQAMLSSGWCRG